MWMFSLLPDDDAAYYGFVRIRHGSIVGVYTVKALDGRRRRQRDMPTLAIQHRGAYRGNARQRGRRSVLPSTTLLFDGVTFTVPKRGENSNCWNSRRSARIYRAEQLKNLEIKNPERYTERLLNALQKELPDRQQHRMFRQLQSAGPIRSLVRGLPR
ncbi:MAG: hypothetical protein ACLRMJ_11200 [Alistipes finegoldii]